MKFIEKTFSWKEIKSSHHLMVLIVFLLGLFNFFFGEKVPAGGGFGWDGVNYANMVRNLDSMISSGSLSNYYAQRILPSGVVRSFLLITGISMNNINIIKSFEIYNLALLIGACFVWRRLADKFSISLAGRWIGFSGIFINFEASKQAFYYPVLTDVTALFVAMLILLFYVEKKPLSLFMTTIVGSFCWPVVSICGALLIFFLPKENFQDGVKLLPNKFNKQQKILLTIFFVVLVFSIIGYSTLRLFPINSSWYSDLNNFTKSYYSLSFLSQDIIDRIEKFIVKGANVKLERLLTGLPSIFGVLIALIVLVRSGTFIQSIIERIKKPSFLLFVLSISVIIVPRLVVKAISNSEAVNPNGFIPVVYAAFFPTEGLFLLPIVTLAAFWGPLILMLALNFNAFCCQCRLLGPGFVAVIAVHLLLGLLCEPRFFTVGWPFFVLGIVLAFESISMKSSFKFIFTIITVLCAQFWLKINYTPWLSADILDLLTFPKQLYFMHYGLWMSSTTYLIQLFVFIFSAIWLRSAIIYFGKNKNTIN
jgi:hypothetical protein